MTEATPTCSLRLLRNIAAAFVVPFLATDELCGQCELGEYTLDGSIDLGRSVAVFGDLVAIGDPNGPGPGSVHLLRASAGTLEPDSAIQSPIPMALDEFGAAVALSDELLVVGAPGAAGLSGECHVFRFRGDQWVIEAILREPGGSDVGDSFGCSVSLTDDRIIVGASGDRDDRGVQTGAAYLFRNVGETWVQEQVLFDPGGQDADLFGTAVAINGSLALVGGHGFDGAGTNSGTAVAFRRNATTWSFDGRLEPADAAPGDWFGFSVGLACDAAIVGAMLDDGVGFDSGSAYVFRRRHGIWTQEEKLTGDDAAPISFFGRAVVISDDSTTALIGASNDSELAFEAGAVYVFRFDGIAWSQVTKLASSTPVPGAHFGTSLAMDHDVGVAGAPGGPGAATVLLGFSYADCNDSGKPDACEILSGSVADADGDGIPDECQSLGDVDGNGVIDFRDLLIVVALWGECPGACPPRCPGDVDGDCVVGAADLLLVLANWS